MEEHGFQLSACLLHKMVTEDGADSRQDALGRIEPVDGEGDYVIQMDGSFVHTHTGWQEVKMAVAGRVIQGRGDAPTLANKRWFAERGCVEHFEDGFENMMSRMALPGSRTTVMGDGARWIWKLYERHFPGSRQLLDFYHAASHVASAVEAVFGAESPLKREFCNDVCHDMKHSADGAAAPIAFIRRHIENPSLSKENRMILQRELEYFRENARRMNYQEAKQLGLPIGSGCVESGHRHVIQERMKGCGMRWSEKGADRMLGLRLIKANGHFDAWFRDQADKLAA